ncbi:hypothetical protein [Caviibacter abscessus]|uniref:hypothetical protein n=1 Tax=Caviibacter abscessus TaxID=1766719 RepID=UPI0012E3501D|nr:hypothetical protein [Caviibacter abscessus]
MKNIVISLVVIFGIILSVILFKKTSLFVCSCLIIIIGVCIPIIQKILKNFIK